MITYDKNVQNCDTYVYFFGRVVSKKCDVYVAKNDTYVAKNDVYVVKMSRNP